MDKEKLINAINTAVDEDDYDECFRLSQVLEEQYPPYGCYYLGMCHTLDWGVDGDPTEAINYFTTSIKNGIEEASSWYFGATVYYNCEQYEEAVEWAVKAYNAGEKDASMIVGNAYNEMEQYDNAINWYIKAYNAGDNDAAFILGNIYIIKDQYDEAVKYLTIADKNGVSGAKSKLALCTFNYANELRNYAAKQISMSEYSQTNAAAITNYLNTQYLYYHAASDSEEREYMFISDYIILGRATSMLYNLAVRGELSVDMVEDNSIRSYFTNSFKLVSGAMNKAEHEKWWNNAMNACALMDVCGFPIVGEFFRAECCLTDCELNHSAEAYYRARWHLKNIGEMRGDIKKYDMDDLVTLFQSVGDIEEHAEKLSKKYSASMQSMMSGGIMPDLTRDYPDGKAPDPKSCKSFMEMVKGKTTVSNNTNYNATINSDNSNKGGLKKIFGLFGKRG